MGFPTPEQGDKFNMPVTHIHLIRLSPPPGQNVLEKTPFLSAEFSVLGIVQNASKLGVEKPRKYILRGFRELQLFKFTGYFWGLTFLTRLARCTSDAPEYFQIFCVSENETNLQYEMIMSSCQSNQGEMTPII